MKLTGVTIATLSILITIILPGCKSGSSNNNGTPLLQNNAPAHSTISGHSAIYADQTNPFVCLATDPDGDAVRYEFDWNGDSVVDEESGTVSSDTPVSAVYAFTTAGTYTVRCRAKDGSGDAGNWSDPLTVDVSLIRATEDSPFGFQDLPSYDQRMTDLGSRWARLSGTSGLVWDADEPQPGVFDWTRTDAVINEFIEQNVKVLVTILVFNKWDQQGTVIDGILKYKLPNNLEAYTNYLKEAVKRYPQVRYYQIENEPTNAWLDTPENFAKLVKISALAIKEVNPDAEIVLAGAALPEDFDKFYVPIFLELERLKDTPDSKYIDIADLHWSGQFEYQNKTQGNYRTETLSSAVYDVKAVVRDFRMILDDFDYGKVPLWITEMSEYSGRPIEPNYLYQSEQEHAIEVCKRYVHSLALNVKKIFWVGLLEDHNYGGLGVNNYWDCTGLINNPLNDGESHNKLAYFTYKKMVEMLEGSEWNAIETLQDSGNVHIYKFMKNGNSVYVAWWDYFNDPSYSTAKTTLITLSGLQGTSAVVTESVPKFATGAEVTNYATAFNTSTLTISNGSLTFSLGENPVFMEVLQ
jgi:hypothetical protein